ncbi:MAG: glycosyltransferase family 4 protein [Alcanivoracaceae bacterium]|nr:glycosyltransferase family 4 protein [Alcanivoracaceae bacterium]
MKVLVISNLFPLPWEPGRGLFNAQQFRVLAQRHQVHVVVPVAWREWWRHRKLARISHDYHGITVTPVPYFYLPGIWRASYAVTMWLSLCLSLHRFRDWHAEVILATWLYPDAVAAVRLGRQLGVPVLMKAHGSDVNVQCQAPARRRQVVSAAASSQAVIAVSADLTNQLRAFGINSQRLHTLYNGIDLQRFAPLDQAIARTTLAIAEVDRVLLYVGNLKESKGVLDLVEALARLPHDCWQQCVVIGDGEDRVAMEKLVQRSGLVERIKILGRLPHEQIALWMAACDLLLLPSHAEGVPNVVLEAMACGRPVVASELPGICEVTPDYAGVTAPARQPEAFARAIEQALAQSWDASRIRQHAETFSWQQNVDNLEALLYKAVSDRHHD